MDRLLDECTDFNFTNQELQGSIESSVIKIMLRRKNEREGEKDKVLLRKKTDKV